MKLISMTDFVLSQTELLYDKNQSKLIHNIVNYAQFLKQPLKLEMFVPCNEEGNVLEEQKFYYKKEALDILSGDELEIALKINEKVNSYRESKEKVLFEGCSTLQQGENTIVMFNGSVIWLTWTNRIIEDLLKDRVILTQNAIKQLGL